MNAGGAIMWGMAKKAANTPPTPLAERIGEILSTTGWTNAEFARKIKRSRTLIGGYLDGTINDVKSDTAKNIEEATGYGAVWVATGGGIKRPRPGLTLAFSQEIKPGLMQEAVDVVEQAILDSGAEDLKFGTKCYLAIFAYQNGEREGKVDPGTVRAMLHLVKNAKK